MMKQIDIFKKISQLFSFKVISDEDNNSYVIFSNSSLQHVNKVKDRTQFEAIENHIHLIEKVRKYDYQSCIECGTLLGFALLNSLQAAYPFRHFIVYVAIRINDSMIIRFHQKWPNEEPYYDPIQFSTDKETVLKFEK